MNCSIIAARLHVERIDERECERGPEGRVPAREVLEERQVHRERRRATAAVVAVVAAAARRHQTRVAEP